MEIYCCWYIVSLVAIGTIYGLYKLYQLVIEGNNNVGNLSNAVTLLTGTVGDNTSRIADLSLVAKKNTEHFEHAIRIIDKKWYVITQSLPNATITDIEKVAGVIF